MVVDYFRQSSCTTTALVVDQDLPYEDFQKSVTTIRFVAYQIIAPTLIVLGILGNILNLTILTRPLLSEGTRIYLRALAITDLNVLIFAIPTIIRLNCIEGKTFLISVYHAHVELVVSTTFLAFNIYIVLCLTIDRYISVCVPEIFNSIHTKRKVKLSLFVCFIIALVVSSPLVLLKNVYQDSQSRNWGIEENTTVTCTLYWHVYIIMSEIFIRIGPAIVLTILNILIIRRFRTITKRRKQQYHINCKVVVSTPRHKKYKEEKRLIVLLQAVIVLFFITMTPASCLSFMYSEAEETNLNYQIFRAVANLLEITNSTLNFCGYFLCNKEFRKIFVGIFNGRSSVKRDSSENDVKIVSVQTVSVYK